ncbi:unnamed protein product [Lasius platythorax]|uniref:Uncharacterized protein n=1 Tax=Lasius platythorax TaxID=488582 RepID=A0AAV2NTL5_9HYME
MAPTKRTSRQLTTVHHTVFKWSIRSTFGSLQCRIWERAVLARCCLLQGPQMFALFSFPGFGSGGRSYSVIDLPATKRQESSVSKKFYKFLLDAKINLHPIFLNERRTEYGIR